ncbi:hypothetical protein MHL31_08605 [Lutibacter sp. A80]|uniref:hypothetical protein n=1 Tax=Lutibacter sp. A80 TaxID=2918453 RepID=UPI001F06EB2A|nr:hypothetical protein [Lutibacter sp. A80]UMB59142.1 hypothetical protein MHL31_08605 [Lutibacter sp. A80]
MSHKSVYIGSNKVLNKKTKVKGTTVVIEGETYYKISNSNTMRPFFMSIVSDSNHWMFIASNGGLTAGRKDSDNALFPYYTDDKITESSNITGSKTIFKIHKKKKILLWEPFSDNYEGIYKIQRNLYKNRFGNKIIFEEKNKDLGLTFRYQWSSSNLFGFVKKSTLINSSDKDLKISVLDGFQNIVPYGVKAEMQNGKSNLVDAYKKSELEANIGLGIYALSAVIVDKAEPSEALKATIAWSIGLENPTYLISSLQLDKYRKGKKIKQEYDIRAEKGAYFVSSEIKLRSKSVQSWFLAANVNQGPSAIVNISEQLKKPKDLLISVKKDIDLGTQNLIELTGNADGLQVTEDSLRDTRHFANVLFNNMRGGIFDENYTIELKDFKKYILNANKQVYTNQELILNDFPEVFSLKFLQEKSQQNNDLDFKRLCAEYLPLKFSRRHGDPSRPWNKFSINTRSEIDGSKILDYEGNWRDIFQNWEALAHSYPAFIENMIFKFLNATTFEGYNPYRVTKGGFDWEIVEPDDPWSFIGYWGDHQLIYLLKFLEFIEKHYPKKISQYFKETIFVYANVPYKIKNYEDIVSNPKDTIDFDFDLDKKIRERKTQIGADGALLLDQNNTIYKVNLIEKLLATVLVKVSNFIPEAGIWLNTQRPEWNDANNALVGNGVSMVTLYHLRRFLKFFNEIVSNSNLTDVEISEELALFLSELASVFEKNKGLLEGVISDSDRKKIADKLGSAAGNYRASIYKKGFSSNKSVVVKSDLQNFILNTIAFLEHSIDANKREDNLYHSYNLISITNHKISISYLPEMLEGQVAALSSGYISSENSLKLLDSLKKSALYRKDQYSYLLYPNKELSRFVDKNNIPADKIEDSKLVQQLLKDNNSQIIEKDCDGNYHFNGNFNNANSLKSALSSLPNSYQNLVEEDKKQLLNVFEDIFNHKEFTGRSGTFFGYEGLGSIYWHMVSKLALAVQEVCVQAVEAKENPEIIDKLIAHYYLINKGIGVHKSPELYGAFPTDPYSHTPAGKGAQQPGMTGQVKEDILNRFGELGVVVNEGKLQFKADLLNKKEFLSVESEFKYLDVTQQEQEVALPKKSLCFTYCQVPIIYELANKNSINVELKDGTVLTSDTLELDEKLSQDVFNRTGIVKKIHVFLILK